MSGHRLWMEELAKKTTDGDFAELANVMNDFFCL